MHIYIYICIHIHTYAYMYIHMYSYYICMCVYIYIYRLFAGNFPKHVRKCRESAWKSNKALDIRRKPRKINRIKSNTRRTISPWQRSTISMPHLRCIYTYIVLLLLSSLLSSLYVCLYGSLLVLVESLVALSL